ncbi:unnamed protein product [Tilletia controversa]|uniref:Uncharacterized protein n=3 Tax=Tilletia TaxID=13289 RepID=A0A8X7MRF8_9BASI|nr:hypothetical protein CF328_g5519 [Tilletia controversa]KAE8236771.1 hypothetical protein A4X03_0g9331 [Tilletia caries]CAD6907395.1 unnamed protein product [Tilletia laevis]KAE8246052.1 hypothetical protein A4X06_0g5225 [Tilletia controversa]CAD6886658.1 unnamed protein product [Tilletia caries]
MFQTHSRAFSPSLFSRSAAAFGGSARVQYRPRVGAVPSYPTTTQEQTSMATKDTDIPSGAALEDIVVYVGVPFLANGKLAAEPHFHDLLSSIGTLSAPGVRVEVYNDA